jgi:hypothetical protein
MKEYRNEKGELHRLDGPAIIGTFGHKSWYLNGKLHRIDGPAIEKTNGEKEWFFKGKRHRIDGPAIERVNGDKYWYQHDKLHRLNGPAIECHNGSEFWWVNGKRHRLDGPAFNESNSFINFINNRIFSQSKFQQLTYFPKEKYSTNEADITHIRLEDNLGVRISLYTELWIDGVYRIIEDETLDQLIRGIDKENPTLNPLHDYILENLTSLNV